MNYQSVMLNEMVKIEHLYTIHYFEYMNDFSFEGESHNFWEFCFVDKGEVSVTAGDSSIVLKRGDIAFHKPNEFHTLKAFGGTTPNLVVVSFQCESPYMDFFQDKVLRADEAEKNLLAEIIIESKNCFTNRLDDPYSIKMVRRGTPDAALSEQIIRINLEHFLIHLFRRYSNQLSTGKKITSVIPKSTKTKSDSELFSRVKEYMEQNLSEHITIEEICRQSLLGRSQLQKIFRDRCGLGVIEYFSMMKINAAKEMIRTNRLNFTQISEQLGYSSIHYFSRQFKKITNMTPSEYASSIKALAEGHFQEEDGEIYPSET